MKKFFHRPLITLLKNFINIICLYKEEKKNYYRRTNYYFILLRVVGMERIFIYKEAYVILYLLIVNISAFILVWLDKYKAKRNRWRIKERTFFIFALLGAAMGIVLGMTMFRHKTQHKSFYIGIPIIFFLNVIILMIIAYRAYIL